MRSPRSAALFVLIVLDLHAVAGFAQWVKKSNGLSNQYVTTLCANGTDMYAGTHDGLFLSSDLGETWFVRDTGLTTTWVRGIAVNGLNIFAGTYGGVFLSTDRGGHWSPVNSGLTSLWVSAITVSNGSIFAETDHGLFRSTDNGSTWTSGLQNSVSGFLTKGSFFYAGGTGLFVSSDNGQGWTPWGSVGAHIQALAADGTNLFAATNGGALVSTDQGTSWTRIDTGLTTPVVRALASPGQGVFAATWDGVLLFSGAGASWTQLNTGLQNYYSATLAISGGYLFGGDDNGAGIYRLPLSSVLPIQLASFLVEHEAAGAVRVAWRTISETNCYGFILEKSGDGTSWENVGVFVPGHGTTTSPVAYSLVVPLSGGDVWLRLVQVDLDGTRTAYGASLVNADAPARLSLFQNYPNPFNPSTSIRYSLPARSHVALSVYSVLGQCVATLVDGVEDAGTHEVRFDATRLASGVYVYRLLAGGTSFSRRMSIVR